MVRRIQDLPCSHPPLSTTLFVHFRFVSNQPRLSAHASILTGAFADRFKSRIAPQTAHPGSHCGNHRGFSPSNPFFFPNFPNLLDRLPSSSLQPLTLSKTLIPSRSLSVPLALVSALSFRLQNSHKTNAPSLPHQLQSRQQHHNDKPATLHPQCHRLAAMS
jgi:hypothetical protein